MITVDTHHVMKTLEAHGYAADQAEGFVRVIQELNLDRFATRDDIYDRFTRLDRRLDERFTALDESLNHRLKGLETGVKYDVLKWVVPLILGLYGLVIFNMGGFG